MRPEMLEKPAPQTVFGKQIKIVLGHKTNRSLAMIMLSISLDLVLFVFYFVKALAFNGSSWEYATAGYYFLLLAGKMGTYLVGRKKQYHVPVRYGSAVILILLGLLTMGRTYQYSHMERVLIYSESLYVLNGTIFVVRTVIQAVQKRRERKQFGVTWFTLFRNYYFWAEFLIAFTILFSNLITTYQWDDADLALANTLQGQISGLIIIGMGITLVLRLRKSLESQADA